MRSKTILALLCATTSTPAFAAAFTMGNVVVSRLGDGASALSGNSAAVFLDEFTSVGAPVQSIPLPAAQGPGVNALTISGTATSQGFLSRSSDGRFLTIFGNDAPANTTGPNSNASFRGRTVGLIGMNGIPDTATRYEAAGTAPRSAFTTNGTDIWTTSDAGSGGTGGLRYNTYGATTLGPQLNSTTTNTRVVNVANNQLYFSAATGVGGAFRGVMSVGTGLPTTGSQTFNVVVGGGSGSDTGPVDSAYDFYFADANTLYVADDDTGTTTTTGGLQKWVFSSGSWTQVWRVVPQGATGLRSIAGEVDSLGNVNLYGITSVSSGANALVGLTDTLAGTLAGSFSTLATSGTNQIFRGVDFAPIPEPASAGLLACSAMLIFRRRQR